jgi:exopolyphosphatase/guanosine-5'-triphosphate,3'-diphosphate pyrophosphatase
VGSESEAVIAALDIGTNSFHLVVAKPVETGFEVITSEKEVIRLGHGAGDMKQLEPEAIERGIASLKRMRAVTDVHGAKLRAVATSAVREAKNRNEFIKRARKEADIDVEVISGVEEARLIHLGARYAVAVGEQPMLLCDIGGGSTELVVAAGDEILLARSFKLGAVRLTDRFFSTDALHPSALSSCRKFVRSMLATVKPEVLELGFEIAVGSSGSVEAVAKLIRKLNNEPELKSFNRYEFDAKDVTKVLDLMADTPTVKERAQVFGLDSARAEIILAGAVILEGIALSFDVSKFTYSDYALREGVLFDTLAREKLIKNPEDIDPALLSVKQLADRCDDRPEHSAYVAKIALSLFDCLQKKLALPPASRRYLEAAALLANVGVVVSHSKHHLHSYYVIRNSELVGLTDREIELIAVIARYHRKSAPKQSHAEFAQLSEADQKLVTSLAAILRIAIGLDRTQDGRVKSVTVRAEDEQFLIFAKASAKADIELNLYAANERRNLLADVLATKVKILALK